MARQKRKQDFTSIAVVRIHPSPRPAPPVAADDGADLAEQLTTAGGGGRGSSASTGS